MQPTIYIQLLITLSPILALSQCSTPHLYPVKLTACRTWVDIRSLVLRTALASYSQWKKVLLLEPSLTPFPRSTKLSSMASSGFILHTSFPASKTHYYPVYFSYCVSVSTTSVFPRLPAIGPLCLSSTGTLLKPLWALKSDFFADFLSGSLNWKCSTMAEL